MRLSKKTRYCLLLNEYNLQRNTFQLAYLIVNYLTFRYLTNNFKTTVSHIEISQFHHCLVIATGKNTYTRIYESITSLFGQQLLQVRVEPVT